MAALVKARAASVRNVFRDKRPLQANIKVWKGGLAAVNAAGFFGPATGAATEVVVGRFYESVDNTGGANGDRLADIQHMYKRELLLVDNDVGGSPVTVAQRERPCGLVDDHTATATAADSIRNLIVYDVTTEGVWLDIRVG